MLLLHASQLSKLITFDLALTSMNTCHNAYTRDKRETIYLLDSVRLPEKTYRANQYRDPEHANTCIVTNIDRDRQM